MDPSIIVFVAVLAAALGFVLFNKSKSNSDNNGSAGGAQPTDPYPGSNVRVKKQSEDKKPTKKKATKKKATKKKATKKKTTKKKTGGSSGKSSLK
jgi:hypothetical protein